MTLLALLLLSAALPAQDAPKPAPPTLAGDAKFVFKVVSDKIRRTAEKMPEADYAFRPADTVRTYAQVLLHIAEARFDMCAQVLGGTAPKVDLTRTDKAGVLEELRKSAAYCAPAYEGLSDARLAEPLDFFGGKRTRGFVLFIIPDHDQEHYGNLVTYLRIKGIVPPASEPQPPAKKD